MTSRKESVACLQLHPHKELFFRGAGSIYKMGRPRIPGLNLGMFSGSFGTSPKTLDVRNT